MPAYVQEAYGPAHLGSRRSSIAALRSCDRAVCGGSRYRGFSVPTADVVLGSL